MKYFYNHDFPLCNLGIAEKGHDGSLVGYAGGLEKKH